MDMLSIITVLHRHFSSSILAINAISGLINQIVRVDKIDISCTYSDNRTLGTVQRENNETEDPFFLFGL